MRVRVPFTILVDVPTVKRGTKPQVSAQEILKAIRAEVLFIGEAAFDVYMDEKHVSLEEMVRHHLIEEGLLEKV